MIKRFNYTGRQRILREDAKVVVTQDPGRAPVFRVDLKLDDYGFPGDAFIRMEAQRQSTWMSFSLGTVGTPDLLGDHELSEFGDAEGVQFRLRVVSAEAPRHVVLGAADNLRGISPGDDPDGREPLLPVTAADLGMEVWKLADEGRPMLLMNKDIKNWRAAAKHPAFIATVYPEVMRRLLKKAVVEETDREDTKDDLARWVRFAEGIPGVPAFASRSGSSEDWIEDAVRAFCRSQKILERFVGFWEVTQ